MRFQRGFPGLLTIITIIIIMGNAYGQRQADRWYFGRYCGLNFNSGEPVVLYDNVSQYGINGVGTISDSIGNLLFYSTSAFIYTSQHTVMENGDFVGQGGGIQSELIVKWPESDSLYFLFKTRHGSSDQGVTYNIIDISKNNGLGAVIEKNISLDFAWDASHKVTATMHNNKRDIWVITRKFREDSFAAFLITPNGINEVPILSPAPDNNGGNTERGFIKFSYDKKYLFSSYWSAKDIEVCHFDYETGEIEVLYELNTGRNPDDIEFSPDSKFAYISYQTGTSTLVTILQYNMDYVDDVSLFITTAIDIAGAVRNGYGLQLATDGKIYCIGWDYSSSVPDYFIGVINNPWVLGSDCQYDSLAINMYPGEVTESVPNVFMDFLYRFEFDGLCAGTPFLFTSNFNPVPDSIRWLFNDPGSGFNNVSYDLNPVHIFSTGGNFEVEVDVWYPSGRFEHTSREVEVEYSPEPDLGPDTTICNGQQVVLDAECGPHSYSWSTGQLGTSQITVSDSGWYWVSVTNNVGCTTIDSIYLGYHEPAVADITNLVVSPTTCGGSTGVIKGIILSGTPPLTFQWVDDVGNPIGSTLDLYDLPVGNYTLLVNDGIGCTTEIGPYTIYDAGDVLIQDVNYTQEHCGQQDGSITVTAISGLGDMLFYSIDNGANYYSNQGIFTGLPSGSYVVRVRDSTDCQSVFIDNPVIIQNMGVPDIIDVQITPSSVGMNNGSIDITASGASDTLYYSNDNGINFQINNGGFYNLIAGFYTCVVADEFGCDTTFVVEVTEEVTIRLQAVAGDQEVCPGNSAFVPLMVSNFNDVGNFKTTLLYNKDLLTCQGFANAHPQLLDSLEVLLFPAEGKVELFWASTAITLANNTIMSDLVFQALDQGLSIVDWDGTAGSNYFENSIGLTIPVDYFIGTVKIYSEVDLSVYGATEICQGETLSLEASVWYSNGSPSFLWTEPNGDTSSNMILTINNIQQSQSGIYHIIATDTLDCYAESSIDVIIYLTPSPEFAVQDTIFTDDPFDLDAGGGFIHYLWNTGDTTQMIWVEEKGWYSAEVESPEGCIGVDSSYVLFSTLSELIKIFFPNAFTPNGDGLNDEFKPVTVTEEIEHFSLSIYNRWGAMIYQTNDITKGWNGTYNGALCQPGYYVYKIAYSTFVPSTAESEIKMGTVMLIR